MVVIYENDATILENQSALKGVVGLRAATTAEKSFALRECSSVLSLCSDQSVILPIHEAVTGNRIKCPTTEVTRAKRKVQPSVR